VRLRTKLVLTLTIFVLTLNLFVFWYFPKEYENTAVSATRRKAVGTAAILAAGARPAIEFYEVDPEGLDKVLAIARRDPDVLFMRVLSAEGKELRHLKIGPHRELGHPKNRRSVIVAADEIQVQIPVFTGAGDADEETPVSQPRAEHRTIGAVQVGFSLASVRDRAEQTRTTVLWIGLALLAVEVILALTLGTALVRPLDTLVRRTRAISDGSFDVSAPIQGKDEVADLARAFNDMTASLRRTTVSKSYVDEILTTMVDALIVVGLDGKIRTVNRATCTLLGFEEAEVVDRSFEWLLAEGDGGTILDRIGKEGTVENLEVLYQTKGGKTIPITLSGAAMRSQAGALAGAVLVGRDMRRIHKLMREVEEVAALERQRARELEAAFKELGTAHQELENSHRVLQDTQTQLLETSRRAGMAEVAISVLHNVGNVLNSVNVAAELIRDKLKSSRTANLSSLARMLAEHQGDLALFLTEDPRGQRIPSFVDALAKDFETRAGEVRDEITGLVENVGHIKNIIMTQQTHARVVGVDETMVLGEVISAALEITGLNASREGIVITLEGFDAVPRLRIDRHKVMQVLVNLLSNAKHAVRADTNPVKELRVLGKADGAMVRVTVQDNGVGIAKEHLTKIFAFGFTTKPNGHGFGLHSSANAARELGGSLTCHSEGVGFGSAFTFEFPLNRASEVSVADTGAGASTS
jgi:PAS domain S-box-containing protein